MLEEENKKETQESEQVPAAERDSGAGSSSESGIRASSGSDTKSGPGIRGTFAQAPGRR